MDSDHLKHYREFGYAVVRGVFDVAEVGELAEAFDRVYAQGLAHGRSFRHRNVYYHVGEDRNLGTIVRMVQWPSYFDAVLDRVRLDPRLAAIAAPIAGGDLKQIINQMHWKPPGAAMAEFGYHQDSRFRRPREAFRALAGSYVQTGIAVDPHRAANGAMTVYPGSHLMGELGFEERGRVMHTSASADDLSRLGLDPDDLVTLELDPGDVAYWHVHTVHGSGPNPEDPNASGPNTAGPNVSDGARRLYINGYVTAANCDRGEWAFRAGQPVPLGDEPALVHYEELHDRPEPHYVDTE